MQIVAYDRERVQPSCSGFPGFFDVLRMATDGCEQSVGGWGGIRTLETLARLPVFKTGAFNRSATHPRSTFQVLSPRYPENNSEHWQRIGTRTVTFAYALPVPARASLMAFAALSSRCLKK